MRARRSGGRASSGSARWDEGGQALVEFALLLPVLLLVIAGALELTDASRTKATLVHAAREAARVAVLPDAGEAEVLAVVKRHLDAAGLEFDPARVRLSCEGAAGLCRTPGTLDTVRIDHPYAFRLLGPAARLVCARGGCRAGGTDGVVLWSAATARNE